MISVHKTTCQEIQHSVINEYMKNITDIPLKSEIGIPSDHSRILLF